MIDNSVRNEDICKDKILEGMTNDALGTRYELSFRTIRHILASNEGSKYIEKYKQLLEEIVNETIEAVKKRAGKDAMKWYDKLVAMVDGKDTADTVKLRAILSLWGVAGIKIKQDEDVIRDLPHLTIGSKKKQSEPEAIKKAG